jgi:hypothetical protein
VNDGAAVHAGAAVMRAVIGRAGLSGGRRALAGKTRPCAGKGNQAGKNGSEKGKKDDRLIHALTPSSG